jgi:hypothetical protein
MTTNTYIDDLTTRNFVKFEEMGYVAYFYEDFFMGEWFANFNIFKDGLMLMHATLIELPPKVEEMRKMFLDEINRIEFVNNNKAIVVLEEKQ